MRKFEEYIGDGIVKKQSPNRNRAFSLLKEAEDKKAFLELTIKSLSRDKMSANFIANYCYDIVIELIRAKMFMDGYNAGGSHEAEVSFMRILGFSEADTVFMDELRYFRNGTKYYGTMLDMDYAGKTLNFMNKHYSNLRSFIK